MTDDDDAGQEQSSGSGRSGILASRNECQRRHLVADALPDRQPVKQREEWAGI